METSVPSEALTQAMTARRWERWADGWFRCPFEHGFLDELTVLVRNDVVGAVGGGPYRASFVHTAGAVRRRVPGARSAPPPPGPWRDPGADAPDPELLADVLLGLDAPSGDMRATLHGRGWEPMEGMRALRRVFDLRMFEDLEPRITADLAHAAEIGGRPVEAVWAVSSRRVVELGSAPPRVRRALPWD